MRNMGAIGEMPEGDSSESQPGSTLKKGLIRGQKGKGTIPDGCYLHEGALVIWNYENSMQF